MSPSSTPLCVRPERPLPRQVYATASRLKKVFLKHGIKERHPWQYKLLTKVGPICASAHTGSECTYTFPRSLWVHALSPTLRLIYPLPYKTASSERNCRTIISFIFTSVHTLISHETLVQVLSKKSQVYCYPHEIKVNLEEDLALWAR